MKESDTGTFDGKMLQELQQDTFRYFLNLANEDNGLIPDNTSADAPSSIIAVGLALACYAVGVERGYMERTDAIARTLTTLRFLYDSPQSPAPDATGYKGFFYHFLDMETGKRAPNAELSTVDSAFLLVGALTAGRYFDRATPEEQEIRDLAHALYRRADWQWALNDGLLVSQGWSPENDFIEWRWEGYSEALLLYALGLGSPTYPLPAESYSAWTRTYEWKAIYGYEFLYAGPLFIHQLSHIWIDFRGIQDDYMRARGIDYFENSRRATYVQQAYACDNPHNFDGYGKYGWGITASPGPGNVTKVMDGVERRFYAYKARGVPDGPDDGTLSPWASIASLPFAPELVLPTIDYFIEQYPQITNHLGFICSFNPTFMPDSGGWVSDEHYGLNQGPIVLMIENYLTGLLWDMMRDCTYLVDGLRRAGFSGGWLDAMRKPGDNE